MVLLVKPDSLSQNKSSQYRLSIVGELVNIGFHDLGLTPAEEVLISSYSFQYQQEIPTVLGLLRLEVSL